MAGNSLSVHNNQQFTTRDRDNDNWNGGNCAVLAHGAWWYKRCYSSNLNGKYYKEREQKDIDGIRWNSWIFNSLKAVQMMIRPNAIN